MRYIYGITTIPPAEPDNALIMGQTVHTGIEKSLEEAIKEYSFSYPIITDEHINEIIKFETVIPLARAAIPPGGAFEVEIADSDFHGFIDYLVPVGDGYFDLYDFKYSNNVSGYKQSNQLHLYKYFWERNNPGKKIRNMYFLFIPKVSIRQKKTETLLDFRQRLKEELAGAEVKTVQIGFNPEKVIEFLFGIKAIKEEKDNIAPFGGRKRCNLTNDGKVVAYYGEAGFTTTGKLTQAVTIAEGENAGTYAAGTIVQTMVEQPKFYYKVVPLLVEHNALGSKVRKARYYVSATPKAGFKLHPAFIENGNENEKIYLAAFEGSLWDASASAYILDDAQVADFANDMLCSIANAKPASGLNQNLTRANTRKLAQKRGSGWEQGYAATAAASQLLMLVEYATFNVQSVIGNGAVNKTDDGTTSMTENSGATVSLGNASGAVTNANGIQIVSYRGEENFWGNIWWWVDGMNEQNPSTFAEGDFGTLFVADHGFADDSSASPYKNTGIHPCYGGGYVSAFGWSDEFDWLFIPAEKNGNSSLPVGDYYWNGNPGWRVARLGGMWYDGADAGAFCWSLNSAASGRYRYVGGRLVYVPSKKAA